MLKHIASFFKKTIPSALGMAIIALFTAFSINTVVVLAFSAPSGAPSIGTNVAAPVNVGGVSQIKSGALWVGSLGTDGGASFAGAKVTITSSGNVGIGTASPTDNLQLEDANAYTAGLKISYSPSYYSRIGYNEAANKLKFSGKDGTSESDRMTINMTNGNVGIGTANPGAKLEVAGQIKITGGTPGANKVLTSDASGLASWVTPAAVSETDPQVGTLTASKWCLANAGGTAIDCTTATPSFSETDPKVGTLTTSYVPRWNGTALANGNIVDNGTNVGIGTASPARKLQVEGDIQGKRIGFSGAGGNSGVSGDYYSIYQESGAWVSPFPDLVIQYHTGIKYDAYAGYGGHQFFTGYNGTGNPTGLQMQVTDKVYIAGNVGIGTASPGYKLDVAGDINIVAGSAYKLYGYRVIGAYPQNGSYYLGGSGPATIPAPYYNTANGSGALASVTTGAENTAHGTSALLSNTTGNFNTATGVYALYANAIGSSNTANGHGALMYNYGGLSNTANGMQALYLNTGSYNTANGAMSLYSQRMAHYNTAIGYQALYSHYTNDRNTATGYQALYGDYNGSFNSAYGYRALATNYSGDRNTAIGYMADVTANNLINTIAIGYQASVTASNKAVIGNREVRTVGGYGAWSNYSDARLKENIYYKNDLGLAFIKDLKTASFNYKGTISQDRRDGLIAQDVQTTLKKLGVQFSGLVVDDDAQSTLNLSYEMFTIPLINAVQEQQKQIEGLKTENDALKAENDGLRVRLDDLEVKVNALMIK
ncbi:MAG: tail fiber domain-containing protein [Patescibacteria group bacterium]